MNLIMANRRMEKHLKKHAPFVWLFALALLASIFIFFSLTNSPAALSGSSSLDITNSDIKLKPIANLKVIGVPGQRDISLGFSLPCNEFESNCADINEYELRWRSDKMITQDNWETSYIGAKKCFMTDSKITSCSTKDNVYDKLTVDEAIETTLAELEQDTTYFFAARYFSEGEWSSLSNIVIATTAEKI